MPLAARYGIVSDIHANYTALKVALDHLQAQGVDKILCLGDLVGYGAEPFECIQAVKDKPNVLTIAGNHDRQVIGDKDARMRKTAAKVLDWTADNISPSNARFLRQIPQGMTVDDTFILVHGSLVERDAYILSAQEISKNLNCMINDFPGMKICFFGHTHIPMLIGTKAVINDLRETKGFKLDRNDVYLINPGSVGQPRDKCPLASFAIFDAENWTVTFVRKPYDFRLAGKLIIDNGLPEKFARRLAVGV
ncbi:MAG: metallophosphoesterase family protein [Planctomycetota bacterium]|nr:metallophosphoesterase family protein [Planctomycetota bacterium]